MSRLVNKFALITLFALLVLAGNSPAQNSFSANGTASIASRVVLINTAERRFVVEMSVTQDPSETAQWQPKINIYSYGKSLQYLMARGGASAVESSQLRFFVDGKELPVASREYFYMREAARDGDSASFKSFVPQISGGTVLDENGSEVSGTLGEVIGSSLSTTAMRTIFRAKSLEVRAGAEKFTIVGAQLDQLRESAKGIE
jgi:hypothetical protein